MKRILIVEDQPDIRKLIRMTMEFEAYEIHEASDASDASTALAMAASLQPDLIVMDVMMPGDIDGLQACARLKCDDVLRHIKLILLTARGQQKDREAGLAAGADEYLLKPFSPVQLVDTIERLMATAC
ncbi:response regulator [Paucibacter sp. APW11]|uniref:Response regulator n=1 Tax=Roseateles aquae TaxID=3077235 RepID=A0ABU3PEG6_9BURK|nr:response regulator [Paucibacter sp. APW11]MDT9000990.1 response regulator [Paucibacter sp. APW11]